MLAPFLEPIAAAVREKPNEQPASGAPYPQSELIAGIQWDKPEQIRRKAEGSDNWPVTWGDDGHLYTAYPSAAAC